MRRSFLLVFLISLSFVSCNTDTEVHSKVYAPAIDTIVAFHSEIVDDRNIEVFLPRQYFADTNRAMPVLYVHDGQNVFNAATAYGGTAWELDSTVQQLIDMGEIEPVIVVAVWNNGMLRYAEYCPEKPYNQISDSLRSLKRDEYNLPDEMLADEYLAFLSNELKTYIDKTYRTKPEQEHTFIMGSSMGGLISAYALYEHPNIFGGAACLSTHWPFSHDSGPHPFAEEMISYLQEQDLSFGKIYYDYGTTTLDTLYGPYQSIVDSLYLALPNNQSFFRSEVFEGHAHDEASWQSRSHIPLKFLLGK